MAEPVRPEAGNSGILPDGQDDLGNTGVGERAALPSPYRPLVVTALIQPGGQVLAGDRRQRHGDDRSVADAAASIWECRYRTMAQSASGSPG
ncbi:hypothetical protein [Streptosporangium canum]|uniref:hypothetical protein n=1 Tax=Streptosporangium canum TaxID=324952 RepID=UPI0037B224A4